MTLKLSVAPVQVSLRSRVIITCHLKGKPWRKRLKLMSWKKDFQKGLSANQMGLLMYAIPVLRYFMLDVLFSVALFLCIIGVKG
ncbi:hypothetical protein AMTR_s01475p00004840 [Amborella trichopoda]|uniref:Uncharacterized protein n=1 Tax=Amborella trichopoda TaxID=13333 RepID=U5D9V8_AMBTC|nr:hypothetical protein AMTR_s01475p00004840 [Amborella trichopoda]